jgi:hypothetical protein
LKEYLKYAADVSEGLYQPFLPKEKRFGDTWYLKKQLMNSFSNNDDGKLLPALPFADLSFIRNDEALGLLLTDDEQYFSSISSKETHVYIPRALEAKNWKYRRFYSRNFWNDSEKQVKTVRKFVAQLES